MNEQVTKNKLRGKSLNIMKPQTKYAKVPVEVLAHPRLTPVDKLIVSYLYSQSDSGNFILAYTRIAKELHISKKWIIERWKWLKQHGYIKEDETSYYVMVGTGKGEENTPTDTLSMGEESTPKVILEGEQNTPIEDETKVNKIHPSGEVTTPCIGEQNTPTKVNILHLKGELSTPNEHNKEEKIKSEHKIEQGDQKENLSSSKVQSRYTKNENTKFNLMTGYSDYLQLNPDSKLTFNQYEDLLILATYFIEASKNFQITRFEELSQLVGNFQYVHEINQKWIDVYGKHLKLNTKNLQDEMNKLKRDFTDTKNNNELQYQPS